MVKNETKPLILVDGSSYLYRAFHALPPLVNSKGSPTGAIYGVANMLRKLIADYEPLYMAVVFDTKGKTFREELYEHYKAHRPSMPNDLVSQIEPLYEVIRAQGLPLILIEGIEADDIIGTLAKNAEAKGMDVLISTGDKDFAQLVNSSITLVNTMSNSVLNPQTVVEKFGVSAERIIDYLALMGDSVDNIPGVPQVGPKTAAKWLQEFGSLDNLINHADQIKGKAGENLRASLVTLPLSRTLVTIKCDVDLDLSLESLKRKTPDNAKLIALFQELEFKTWLKDALSAEEKTQPKKTAHYETILTETALDSWLKKLLSANLISFDLQTAQKSFFDIECIGIAFAIEKEQAIYIPLAHDYLSAPQQLSREIVLPKLKPLFESQQIKKIGHDLKQAKEILATYQIELNGIAFDTMLESYVVDSASNRHEVTNLTLKYLGCASIPYEELAGKGVKQLTFNQIPIEKAGQYAAEKVDCMSQLHKALWGKISQEKGLKHVFENIEMPLLSVLARMEMNGVLIDAGMLEKQTIELEARLNTIEEQAFKLSRREFNLNSPKQLQEVLFDELKLPVLQKTPTGQASTADAVLQDLALDFELPKLIIEYRSLSKLISTYTTRLPEQINPKTNRVHTSYNQTGAATGRLSSSDPNLQNIPIRTAEGRRIRQAFIASPDYTLICADYSQIELRIMAHISEDQGLLTAFENNLDIHIATAAEVLGIDIDKVSSDERRNAKAINFGLIYGMSAFGLAKQLGIERQAAQHYIERYFARYPKVRDYMENTRQKAHEKGYVETLWGRRLYIPEINSSQMMRQKAAERAAINAPLQGSSADIIKMAMIRIDDWLQKTNINMKMIMQVHDELVFEVAKNEVEAASEKICEFMMSAATLKVPLVVSIGTGNNWDEAAS